MLACAAVVAACGDQADGDAELAEPTTSAPEDVLSRDPYMGVSCPESNTYACDRVGLAVWLNEPAERIEAGIEGREFALDDPDWSEPGLEGERRMFAGFLQPAGLIDGPLAVTPDDGPDRWLGREPVSATVNLRITRADGSTSTTSVQVDLSPGWG